MNKWKGKLVVKHDILIHHVTLICTNPNLDLSILSAWRLAFSVRLGFSGATWFYFAIRVLFRTLVISTTGLYSLSLVMLIVLNCLAIMSEQSETISYLKKSGLGLNGPRLTIPARRLPIFMIVSAFNSVGLALHTLSTL